MKKLVVLTGAGISAESGLKTFRDSDGLWEGYRVEEVATPLAWRNDPKKVLEFYNLRRRNVMEAKPNAAHFGLAALEEHFDVQIITQNIDDLHERAGSTKVLHLHGSILSRCSERNRSLRTEILCDMMPGELAPDGSPYRPDIVWFGEPVPMIEMAAPLVSSADIFVIVGTSLVVYPAAGLAELAPPFAPKFIIDRRIPYTSYLERLVSIELPATEGIAKLKELLGKLI